MGWQFVGKYMRKFCQKVKCFFASLILSGIPKAQLESCATLLKQKSPA